MVRGINRNGGGSSLSPEGGVYTSSVEGRLEIAWMELRSERGSIVKVRNGIVDIGCGWMSSDSTAIKRDSYPKAVRSRRIL